MSAIIPPPTSGQWRLFGNTSIGSGTTSVVYNNLNIYQDLMILMRNVTASVSGNRQLRLSVDNGATFFSASGDYISIAITGIESNLTSAQGLSTSTASAASCFWQIWGSNISGIPKSIIGSTSTQKLFVGSTLPINAIELTASAANMNAGNIYAMGRLIN